MATKSSKAAKKAEELNASGVEAIYHGECIIFRSKVPAGAQLEKKEGAYKIVADSETTGNHHVVDTPHGVDFYTLDGKRYMRNTVPTNVRCVHPDRHSAITLAPGEWEVGIAQEFDYITLSKRNVQD